MHVLARIQRISAILFAAVLFTWPALFNRYPLFYPDSIGYLHDGTPTAEAIFFHRLVGFTAQRSELYSLGILPLHLNLSPWPVVALNALLTAWVLWLTVRALAFRRPTLPFLAIATFLSLLTSASWFVSLVMPDILGALLYLGIYLLVFCRETLTRTERWALTVLCVWSVAAHATHLLLATGLCLLLALMRRWLRVSTKGLAEVAGILVIAAAAQVALHAYLYGHASLDGKRPPYLMARIVADGPGRLYLEQNCSSLAWSICADVTRLPDNDDAFLWDEGGIWPTASPARQQQLLAEEMPLVRATLRAYPRQQFAASFANFTHQLNDFGVDDFDDNLWMHAAIAATLPGSHYDSSLQARSAIPSNRFTSIQRWVVFLSAMVLAVLLPTILRRTSRLMALAAVLVPIVFANAFLTAVLSSSDARYQARIIWLVPLLAALALAKALTRPESIPSLSSQSTPGTNQSRQHPAPQNAAF